MKRSHGYLNLKPTSIAYHRNGVAGDGFHVVLFDWRADGQLRHMVATLFDAPGQCAVFDVQLLAAGDIEFAKRNSWRGDDFEPELRAAVAAYEDSRSITQPATV